MQNPFKVKVKRIGLKRSIFEDINHQVLAASWFEFLFYTALLYMTVNACFAVLYFVGDGSILNADPNSYWDAFLFSFQTSTTIGYGYFLPATDYANVVALIDAIVGIIFVAITTGLAFGKFSRPTARVLFTENCVITQFDGKKTFMLRVANGRDSHMANAELYVAAILEETTQEGEVVQKIHDINLVRERLPVFFMSWTVMHTIDEKSPLYNLSPEEMEKRKVRFVLSLTGVDDWTAQSVHANHSYRFSDISFNKSFEDILTLSEGQISMDYSKFHSLK